MYSPIEICWGRIILRSVFTSNGPTNSVSALSKARRPAPEYPGISRKIVGGAAIVEGERQRRTLMEVVSDAAADSLVEIGAMLMVVMINDKVWKTKYETENKTQK